MKTRNTVTFALLATLATSSFADDAVGLVRVDAGTNGVVETEMPFSPIDDSGPLGYVSGCVPRRRRKSLRSALPI